METTRIHKHINSPRGRVYQAIVDPAAVAQWMAPDGMAVQVHAFDAREGGSLRVSLVYDTPDAEGKSGPRTDTYHGHFVRLVPEERVEEVIEFETSDPSLQGEMRLVISLADSAGKTQFLETAEPVKITIGTNELIADKREFSTGSFGWYYNGKTTITVDGKPLSVQIGMNLTVVGSKEADR
jgi:uncharacterized protein YndB with AHSA1/START domain